MNLRDLSDRVRQLMLAEIRDDYADGTMYISPRLSQQGRLDWPDLLATAAERGTPESLAAELSQRDRMRTQEMSQRRGKAYTKAVPFDAFETLAEGEFNRYYIRAVCVAAIEDGRTMVTVYRAKRVRLPRRQSVEMEGSTISAASLLRDLRNHQGVDTALGLPPEPNSGLSATFS